MLGEFGAIGAGVALGGEMVPSCGMVNAGKPPKPVAKAAPRRKKSIRKIEDSKKRRAHFAWQREEARLDADKRFNREREGALIPRVMVLAMIDDLAVALRAGLNKAHVAAVATLPLEHRGEMEVALREQSSAVWDIVAASLAKLPEAKPTTETQGEQRHKKVTKRKSAATTGKGKSSSARGRA